MEPHRITTMNLAEIGAGVSFTAIDFETANPQRNSPCAVGLAKVRDGQIVDTWSSFITPHESCGEFHSRNTQVHGLTRASVAGAPTWEEVLPHIARYAGDDVLIAHNAAFDRSVMTKTCALYDMEIPPNEWRDTLMAAKRCLTLASYALPAVCNHLGLPPFEHHDAENDAQSAALVGIALAQHYPEEWVKGNLGPAWKPRHTLAPGDFSSLGEGRPLAGHAVVFTGKLKITNRAEALALVEQFGGTGQERLTKATTMVVTGEFDPATLRPGATLSSKLQKARELAEAGRPIEILNEAEFFERVSLARDELEAAVRAQRADLRGASIPSYVIEQAVSLDAENLAYNQWVRRALAHPDGRAEIGTPCIRCEAPIPPDVYWLFAERHTCSGDCSDALKRRAKRGWAQSNIQPPTPPEYSSSWLRD